MPLYTDSNELYVDDDQGNHSNLLADDEENQHPLPPQESMIDTGTNHRSNTTGNSDMINHTTTSTNNDDDTNSNIDALLGSYTPSTVVDGGAAPATTNNSRSTVSSTPLQDEVPSDTQPQHRVLQSASARRIPTLPLPQPAPLQAPPPPKRLSFMKRSASHSTESSRTHSFRRLNSSSSSHSNQYHHHHHHYAHSASSGALDRSEGSIRSSAGSVHSNSTSHSLMSSFHPFSIKGSFFPGRNHNHSTSSRNRRPSSAQSTIRTGERGGGLGVNTQPRRYKVGDLVLMQPIFDPNDTNAISIHHQFVCLVNKYGFVINDPRCQSDEEYHGPYQYVLASVQLIHFEEIHPYYTVQRYDMMNITNHRSTTTTTTISIPALRVDDYQMEPILTQRHEMAALQAATNTRTRLQNALEQGIITFHQESGQFQYHPEKIMLSSDISPDQHSHHHHNNNHPPYNTSRGAHNMGPNLQWYHYLLLMIQLPFFCIVDTGYYMWHHLLVRSTNACLHFLRSQANLFLYGHEPYLCRIRLTMLNFVVLCSTWFMFADQLRLFCFNHSADDTLATINFGVWVVLICELFGEVFIRPDGYQGLLTSDKAFTPSTVRYINTIHFVVELLALCVYIPEFFCIFTNYSCSERLPFSFYNAVLYGVIGPSYVNVFLGHAYIALVRIRIFCMVRHWKNMWVTRTFINMTWRSNKSTILSNIIPPAVHRGSRIITSPNDPRNSVDATSLKSIGTDKSHHTDRKLTNASNIGTALMVINSYRSLAIVCTIAGLFPIVFSFLSSIINPLSYQMTQQLQATNIVAADTSNATCGFLDASVKSWLIAVNIRGGNYNNYLLTLDIQPRRCYYSDDYFINVDTCRGLATIPEPAIPICMKWYKFDNVQLTTSEIADAANIRQGSIIELEYLSISDLAIVQEDGSTVVVTNTTFSVTTRFDYSLTIKIAAGSSVLLQLFLLLAVLGGLSILRSDVEIFVLGPLRRMLKIVDRYARNPLVQTKISHHRSPGYRRLHSMHKTDDDDTVSSSGSENEDNHSAEEELGSFETEQLITAVAKITDLLRKCWGVAGADIISTNLSTQEGTLTEVFNPTVPGKSVYALFGFVTIGGFDNALRNLGGEVMPLINDVAHVVHGEVFRWGFGDSGQCNKNLGSAFLMVFRIGLVKEVIDKLEQATDVVFSTSAGKKSQVSSAIKRRQFQRNSVLRTSSASNFSSPRTSNHHGSMVRSSLTTQRKQAEISDVMRLSLQSLPGISTFTDRAVIGMLKSYAGIYRDKNVLKWNQRLGASKIGMIFGMDAGWAVEGAVGSEYKIDATYLSPHVNMASRMMSACKQYDVTIMLSQAVQELMSEVAQTKLRHLDTVTVKGSSVKQKIYTYDARAMGVDFFLYSRSDTQADAEAERYSPSMWNTDPDLLAMRQHVTEDFLKLFKDGHKAFLLGDWPSAIEKLEQANNAMFQSAIEDGYLEVEFEALNLQQGEKMPEKFKQDNGDGPSMYLISFMKSYNGVAPNDWEGWHPLIRK